LLFAIDVAAPAQAMKGLKIGYLSSVDAVNEFPHAEGVRLALRELGYIEGQNIAIEYRYSEREELWTS
jgi:putative tryptophan/tyrosine transport system substrate-binding protein